MFLVPLFHQENGVLSNVLKPLRDANKPLGPRFCRKRGLHTLTDHRAETGIDCTSPKQICSQPFWKEVWKGM